MKAISLCLLALLVSCKTRTNNESESAVASAKPPIRLASINDVGYAQTEAGPSIKFSGKDENALSGTAVYNYEMSSQNLEWRYGADGRTIVLAKIVKNKPSVPCKRGLIIDARTVVIAPAGSDCVAPGRYGLNR